MVADKPDPIVLHRNLGAPRRVRRSRKKLAEWKGSFVNNDPYINNARDRRKDRRLRGES